jgi:hypothetical protein
VSPSLRVACPPLRMYVYIRMYVSPSMRVTCPPLRPAACVCMYVCMCRRACAVCTYVCVAEHACRVSSSSTRSMCAVSKRSMCAVTRKLLSPLATSAAALYNANALRQYLYFCTSKASTVCSRRLPRARQPPRVAAVAARQPPRVAAVAACHERVSLRAAPQVSVFVLLY